MCLAPDPEGLKECGPERGLPGSGLQRFDLLLLLLLLLLQLPVFVWLCRTFEASIVQRQPLQ
jgi:hypothetical protein